MKKYLFCIAALFTAAVACTYESVVPEENKMIEETEIAPESTAVPVLYASFEPNEIDTKAGFTYDGAGHYDHFWNAGDHIYVFPKNDEYDIYNCTDASSGEFTLVKDRTDGSAVDKVYAVYNSELGDNNNSINEGWLSLFNSPRRVYTTLSSEYTVAGPDKNGAYGYNNVMVAAVDDPGERLVFKSAVGWLRLQLKGTQKVKSITVTAQIEKILAGSTDDIDIENLDGTPTITHVDGDAPNYKYRTLNIEAPYAQLNTSTATDFYITLPPCTMSMGFDLTIRYADGSSQTITTTAQEYQIKRNTVLKLPVRTVGVSFTDLSYSETANCYIVQSAGNKKFNASVKGNSLESVGSPLSAKVLWESFNTHTAPEPGDIITNVTYLDGYVYFRVPFTNKGNAVIAVYDGENGTGNILWSWHIWVTDLDGLTTPLDYGSYVSGWKLMKVSLGVLESADVPLFYQWGRKDPFYRYATYNVAQYVEGTAHPTAYYYNSSSVAGAIEHPMSFYYGANNSYVWDTGTLGDRVNLWKDDSKTIYDPCPAGWKVMSGTTLATAIGNGFDGSSAGFGNWGNLTVTTTSVLQGSESHHWTSHGYTVSENLRVDFLNHGGTFGMSQEVTTSAANPVRCEKM